MSRPEDPDSPLLLPLDPPDLFLDWLMRRWSLNRRHLDIISCRAAQLSFQETADRLGISVNYAQRLQAELIGHLRSHMGNGGGHRLILRWLAEEYGVWSELSSTDPAPDPT